MEVTHVITGFASASDPDGNTISFFEPAVR